MVASKQSSHLRRIQQPQRSLRSTRQSFQRCNPVHHLFFIAHDSCLITSIKMHTSQSSSPSSVTKTSRQQRALAPSMSIPVVSVQRSSACEHKANSYASLGATALLAKVASSPPTPHHVTPAGTAPPSPDYASLSHSCKESSNGASWSNGSSQTSRTQDSCGSGGE